MLKIKESLNKLIVNYARNRPYRVSKTSAYYYEKKYPFIFKTMQTIMGYSWGILIFIIGCFTLIKAPWEVKPFGIIFIIIAPFWALWEKNYWRRTWKLQNKVADYLNRKAKEKID